MKIVTAAAAAISIALGASPALAGVVITQQQSQTFSNRHYKVEQTVMVQGNKEKIVAPNHELIMDLDKGHMYILDLRGKTYLEMPYPPNGGLSAETERNMGLDFKKTGKTRKVAGYNCEEYTGNGKSRFSELSVSECVSKDAPGAKEYARFEKLEVIKLSASGSAPTGAVPDGIPLSSVRITKMHGPDLSHLPPEQRERVEKAISMRKSVTVTTLVSKIEEKNIPASEFEIPAGFTKRNLAITPQQLLRHPLPQPKK